MKNLLLSICMLVAALLPGQTDSMIIKLDSAQVEALQFKGIAYERNTYQTVDGDTVPIYTIPTRYNTRPRLIPIYNDGNTSDFITPSVLTIDQVKAIVSFPKDDPVYESCIRLIDFYYKMALQNGMSEPEAAHVALTKFGELILTLNK